MSNRQTLTVHKDSGVSTSTFFVSHAALRNMKSMAKSLIPEVSSAHLSEGLAASLGFKTHAALRSKLSSCSTIEVSKPNNEHLISRLRDLGYDSIPTDIRVLLELDRSYGPFRSFPLRKKRGVRWQGWRNLMVSAVNAGLEQGLFGLAPGQNWWAGGATESQACQRGVYKFIFANEISALVSVDAISGDELSINVVLNPRDPESVPCSYSGLADGDAMAYGWVERRLGAWIQDGGEGFACKRILLPRLAELDIEPIGYSDQGSFIL
jgi:hypothetical protein